jgi:hypothetical protein
LDVNFFQNILFSINFRLSCRYYYSNCGKETRTITKLFKVTQIKIAFRTQNTIPNLVKQHPRGDNYNKSGIYQMKSFDCPLKCIGQTGGAFHAKYKNIYKQLEIIIAILGTQTKYKVACFFRVEE